MSQEKSLKRQGEQAISPPSKAARKSFQATIHGAAFSSAHQPPSKSLAMCQPASTSMPTQLNALEMTPSPRSTSIISVSSRSNSVSPPPATLNVNTAFKLIKPNTSTSKPTPISTPASSTDPAMELGPLQWPHELFFIDVVDGLVLYDIKVKQGKHQQTAFVEIFGVPCVRQTLLNKRQLLEKIKQNNEELYDTYLMKGQVDEARWAHFESVAEGKPLRGKERLDLLRSVTRNRRILDTTQDVESDNELDHVTSKINANTEGFCPICHHELPDPVSFRLQRLLDIYAWYEHGFAPGNDRFKEHTELICALHEMESDGDTQCGKCLNWPTTLNMDWIRAEVFKAKAHLEIVIAHALANEQFLNVTELISLGEAGEFTSNPPISVYAHKRRGWLRSAGYFGEKGFAVILQCLQEIFPAEIPLPDTIKLLAHDTFLRFVLVPEATWRLIAAHEGCTRIVAMETVVLSSKWGGSRFPLHTGTAGEDVDVEYANMVDQQRDAERKLDKGKGVMSGEKKKSLVTVKEEEEEVRVVADYTMERMGSGIVYVINDND
ncbi:hypothetical protein JB92DRAFT_3107097 [Gautieria morchelliformis]|nr:hypothetical protein JB92DRAFT_3107097 [Gautieria morchelliformis]